MKDGFWGEFPPIAAADSSKLLTNIISPLGVVISKTDPPLIAPSNFRVFILIILPSLKGSHIGIDIINFFFSASVIGLIVPVYAIC